MGKLVLLLSFIGIGILLLVSLINPNDPVVWLASTSKSFILMRVGMMAVLLSLLVTNPPRNIYLRILVGILSVGAMSWAIRQTYQYQMNLLDTLSILEVGISAGITVLEQDFSEADEPAGKLSKASAS